METRLAAVTVRPPDGLCSPACRDGHATSSGWSLSLSGPSHGLSGGLKAALLEEIGQA